MFAPFAITGSLVVDSSQEMEVLEGELVYLDAQFVVEFALRSPLDALDGLG